MVAYSFMAQFAEPIVTLQKLQTVRGNRKRHARPGEPMQLYTAMRTRQCRKLLNVDPICRDVRDIMIGLNSRHPLLIEAISIDGMALDDSEIEDFAVADGFGGALAEGFARRRMGEFWVRHHEWNRFQGVVLRWTPTIGGPA